jgi:uracil-DNA glycosylase family 4
MNTKPDSCKNCVLFDIGKGFVPDEEHPSKVAILGFCPSKDDVQGRHLIGYAGKGQPIYETVNPRPYIGANGWLLTQNYLPVAGLSRETVSIHNLIKCHVNSPPPEDTLLLAVNHCTDKHLNISDEASLLVTLGEEPWKLLQGSHLPLNDWRGFLGPKPLANGRCQVYATHDPATLYSDPHTRFVSRLDWKKTKAIRSGDYPLPIPRQCVASPSTRDLFTSLLEEALCQPEIMVDTEYIVASSLLTHVGAAWISPPSPFAKSSQEGKTELSSTSQVKGFQLEWVHGDATNVERAIFMKYWPRLCEKVKMGFWNAKADLPILEKNLGCIPEQIEDPMQAHSVLWPDMPHDFEFVASIYGRYPKLKHLSKENILLYHWGDCIDLVWIWEQLKKEFKSEPACEAKYRNQNLKLIPILLEREKDGIRTNQQRIEEAIPQYERLTQAAAGLAQAYCGFPLNLGSTSQISSYLASSEGIRLRGMDQDILARERSKFYPFDADQEDKEGFSVSYIARRVKLGAHPLLELRVMYAKNEKIVNSYLGPLRGVGRVYPQINIHTQVTGRHSTTDPALATFPDNIRDTIMPDEGQVWIGWDWDAQEPRIQWGESGSQILGRAFNNGEDIHTTFVCDLYGWSYPQDRGNPHSSAIDTGWREAHSWGGKEDPRRVFAKQVRYEINYDHTEKAYNAQQKAIRMGIEPNVAQRAATVLLNSDPELRAWFGRIMREGERTRIVRSWGGGRRVFYWADGFSKMPLNEIRNYPLQAGGADLYNLVIVEISEAINWVKFMFGMHDSQKWASPKERWEEAYSIIRPIVEKPRLIGGRMIPFPASFHMIDDQGVVTKL